MRWIIIFLIIFFVYSPLSAQQQNEDSDNLFVGFESKMLQFQLESSNFEEIVTDTINGIIITQEKAKYYYPSSDMVKLESYFTPTRQEVLEAEKAFAEYLNQYKPKDKYEILPSSADLVKYKRQYVGVILKGERKICLIFFCKGNIRFPAILISGGGNCYFNILYNIKDGVFSNLWINADA